MEAEIDERGRITGTGAIVSGYGNDEGVGVLRGKLAGGKLKWSLKVGKRKISFGF